MKGQLISLQFFACVLAALCIIIVSTANADSLRGRILNKLKHGLDATETTEHLDSNSALVSVKEHSNGADTDDLSSAAAVAGLIQINTSPAGAALIQIGSVSSSANAELISLNSASTSVGADLIQTHAESQVEHQNQIKFDCWQRNETTCGSTPNCVWVGSECSISPAAFALQCRFYCFENSCIQPLTGKYDPEIPCLPKAAVYESLCSAVKTEEMCNAQDGLCSWTDQNGCAAATTCCSSARVYCEKHDPSLLDLALQHCQNFTTQEDICNFSSANCEESLLSSS